ncbi:hypothetical protein WG901_07910 [Novosphingobium sp. PS1R-30]|uniref:Lipoprotein n=1 Tax=Novosphingobium anseongense TaxID=3133436 RepID=A0ABU8RTX8_9SPHN
MAPLALAAALAAVTSACSQRVVPPPTPAPSPRPSPAPAPLPQQQRPTSTDWRDMPITPGNWTAGTESGQPVARFAGGQFVLRCDRAAGTVTLQRAGAATGPEPMTVTTSSGFRTLSAAPLAAGGIGIALGVRDPLLDMMAFSRGRFAIEAPNLAPLYVPSWPEVSRVIEDCR